MVMCRTLKALQQLAKSADYIGQALVPYYRQLLPIFNMFKNNNRTLYYSVLLVKLKCATNFRMIFMQISLLIFQLTPEMVLIITKDIKRILEIWFKKRWRYSKSEVVRMHLLTSNIWFQPTNPVSSKKHKHASIDIQKIYFDRSMLGLRKRVKKKITLISFDCQQFWMKMLIIKYINISSIFGVLFHNFIEYIIWILTKYIFKQYKSYNQ